MATNNNFIQVAVWSDRTAPWDPVLGRNYYTSSPLPTKTYNTNGNAHIAEPIIQLTGAQLGLTSAPNALYTQFAYYDNEGNVPDNIITPQSSASFYALL